MEQSRGKLLRMTTVIRRLEISRSTLLRMIRSGDLRAVKIGRWWRVEENSVNELIDKGSVNHGA